MHIILAKLDQASASDNEMKLVAKHAPKWVQTSDPVIIIPARYLAICRSLEISHSSDATTVVYTPEMISIWYTA